MNSLLEQLRDLLPGVPDVRLRNVVAVCARDLCTPADRRRVRMERARGKGRHSAGQWRALLARYGGRCVSCGTKERITKDHIVAIANDGSDAIENIQPLCVSCNSSKGVR